MEGVNSHSNVEGILTTVLDQVLQSTENELSDKWHKMACQRSYFVGANATGFQGLGGELFILVGHQMDTQGEVLYIGLLATQVEDPNFGIRDTSTETRLGVRLVLAVPITVSTKTK